MGEGAGNMMNDAILRGFLRVKGWLPPGKPRFWHWAGLWLVVAPAVVMVTEAGVPVAGNYSAILAAAPGAEMPARAADLVLRANGAQMVQTTVGVVKAAVGVNPAAVLAVVGSVAESAPSMAATAAGAATALEPHLAVAIARAAAASAPGEAGPIVAAVCRAAPDEYLEVALAVAREAPGADRDILTGVVAALPELKPAIDERVASQAGRAILAGVVLAEISRHGRPAPLRSSGDLVNGRATVVLPTMDEDTGEKDASGLDGVTQPQNFAAP
jgi:hypothetical protein